MTTINSAQFNAPTARPGKFEGETGAAVYFWDQVMEGEGEDIYPWADVEDQTVYSLFTVDSGEADAWPSEFTIGDTVVIWECSHGFVNLCAFANRPAAESFINKHAGVE